MRLAALVGAALCGPLLAEGILRFLLFHPSALARSWAGGLRDARNFADPRLEDEYWLLARRLAGGREGENAPPHDPEMGWIRRGIEPETYRLVDAEPIGDRRPVLLYGASYAQGLGLGNDAFEALLARSDLADELCLHNFGVGGYGVGQVLLLLRRTLDAYADRDPVVVLGLVADSDFDRSVLGFRSWPKPRLAIAGGELVSDPVPELDDRVRRRDTGIRSYAWRYLIHAPAGPPEGWRALVSRRGRALRERRELVRAIVLAIRDELDGRGLEWFVLLFTSPRSLPPYPASDAELELVSLFEDHDVPYVLARERVLEAADGDPDGLVPLFVQEGRGRNHPTPLGNRVLFRALRDGLEGRLTGGAAAGSASEDRVDEGRDDGSRLEDDEHDGRG